MRLIRTLFLVTLLAVTAVILLVVGLPTTSTTCGLETHPGFLVGLGHGLILDISLPISFFKDGVGIYEACNSGGWYNAGFGLGIIGILAEWSWVSTDETDGAASN